MVMQEQPRICVLGSSGFIGQTVTRDIEEQGFRLWTPTRHEFDLSEKTTLDKDFKWGEFDCVINMAGASNPSKFSESEFHNLNAKAVDNLLSVLTDSGFQGRVIQASAGYVYGNSPGFVDESSPLNPESPYAYSKAKCEEICTEFHAQGLDICLLRIFNVIGRGQSADFLFGKVAAALQNQVPSLEFGNLNQYRDLNDVRDVASAILGLLSIKNVPLALNISTGKRAHLKSTIEKMCELKEYKGTFERTDSEPASELVGSSKLRESLGLHYQYEIEQTLNWMIKDTADE